MHPTLDRYEKAVMHGLTVFQVMEFMLKLYLIGSFELIRHQTKGHVAYRYTAKDVEEHPLGRLLQLFYKHNANGRLHKDLKLLPRYRNELAHSAFVAGLMRQNSTNGDMSAKIIEIERANEFVEKCRNDLYAEYQLLEQSFTQLGLTPRSTRTPPA